MLAKELRSVDHQEPSDVFLLLDALVAIEAFKSETYRKSSLYQLT